MNTLRTWHFLYLLALAIVIMTAAANDFSEETENSQDRDISPISLLNSKNVGNFGDHERGTTLGLVEKLRKYLDSHELSDQDVYSDDISLSKKAAPKRIFIGKRMPMLAREGEFEYDSNEDQNEQLNVDKKSSRRHLYLGKRSSLDGKRSGQIHRIFIGKRGEIKRIFIG